MSVETIDLTNYRDRTGARVPEGDYLVQIEDIEVGESSTGFPMWTVYMRIVGGEQDGQTLVDRLTMTEKAMFRVVGFLHGLGIKTARKRIRVDTSKLVGKKARVQVADGEPYRGTVRSEVRNYQRFVSAKAAAEESAEDELDDIENVSDEPTDYDEDQEPEKAKAAAAKKAKSKPAPVEADDDEDDDETPATSDDDELDLDDIEV